MSDSDKTRIPLASRELAGMGLFTLSALVLVLVGLALSKGSGAAGSGGTAAIAYAIAGAVGYVPPLVAAGGFALVGAALALSGREVDAGRHLGGFLFAAIGLAVCLGALRAGGEGVMHGGAFGDATGGALRAIGAWAGVLVGGAIALAAVWLAWLGGGLPGRSALALARRAESPAPTLSDALSERDADGVSSAEANALVPDPETLTYMEELWRSHQPHQPTPIPPSPYPDDVRQKGEIPEGTTPLALDDDDPETWSPADDGAPVWRPSPPAGEAQHAPGGDLALEPDAPASPASYPRVAPAGTTPLARPAEGAGPPAPAWEQPDLFEEDETGETEEEDDEEVVEDELDEEEQGELDDEEEDEYEEDELEEDELEEDELEEDDTEEDEEAAEEAPDPAPARAADEPEVVLQPSAPPAAGAGSPSSDADEPTHEELLHEAGCLFLTHGRVAVSLLQRRFGLDFDDACEVLDELQELGLIGPYLGGQKRDILLTREEWEGRVAGP